jgi:predicted transcriptional regulator
MVTDHQNRRIAELARLGLTSQEVAEVLGMGATAVRHRIARMRANGDLPSAAECRAIYVAKVAAMVVGR